MAAKKRAPKKTTAPLPAPGLQVHGPDMRVGMLHMHPSDLTLLELARLRNEQAVQGQELITHKLRQLHYDEAEQLRAILPKEQADAVIAIVEATRAAYGSMKADQSANAREVVVTHNELVDVLKALAAAYDQDFTKVSYDVKTGLIHVVQPNS